MCQMVTSDSQSARPIRPTCANLTQNVARFNMRVTAKTNRSSFCLIILKLSLMHWIVCSVYYLEAARL